VLRSARAEIPVPVVIRLTNAIKIPIRRVPLTRRTLLARDGGLCQVAGCKKAGRTIDHLVPKSRGGLHEWTNVALMCEGHNQRKGDHLMADLGWTLKTTPIEPRYAVVLRAAAAAGPLAVWEPWLAAA
jgi:5-methylcytosine-specific restriction endonuclease McrA